jgi:hypothetical protein
MDAQELEQKRQEAIAAGYSDEEIQKYLQSLSQPQQNVSQQQPMDRSQEYLGMAQGIGGKALEYGTELYAGKKLVLDPILDAFKNKTPPTTNVNVQQAPQQQVQQTMQGTGTSGRPSLSVQQGGLSQPVNPANINTLQQGVNNMVRTPVVESPSMLQKGMDIASKVRGMAFSKLLPAAQVGMGLFYTSPEEIATLKAAEEQRKRQGLTR